ncbi:MAG TPA: plastocyanin/azurin family copper-binding protein [Rhizomicrobium sp.]|nr:plastocyanin/azurin family copper-binding protein [Rhizomicrobium sp.]
MMKIHRRAFAQMLAALGLSSGQALAEPKTVEVTMKQAPKARFAPDVINISVGDTVHWTNPAFVTHTVTFDPAQAQTAGDVALPGGVAPFGSGDIDEDQSYSHTFTAKGTYKYVCKYHEAMGMLGTVIVA